MAIPVLILGESGTGKSASLRNFKKGEVAVINVAGKPLPFRSDLGMITTDKYPEIVRALTAMKTPSAVVDDAQYLLANEFMRRSGEIGFQKQDIDFDKLPEKFVLKCTHDCGSTVIVRDKSKMDKSKVLSFLGKCVSKRYGYDSCEPHYTFIKPRLMAESLIEMDNTDAFSSATTVDHKIRCIDGKAQYDMVCYDRSLESGSGGSKTVYDLYDIHTWQPMRQYLADPGVNYKNVPRPVNLEKMIEIAEKIAQGFPQVRVDLYNVNGNIYFGEMTFFAFSGMNNHFTMEFQRMIGDRINLPKV